MADLSAKLAGRDFLTLQDFTAAEISVFIATARDLKARQKAGTPHHLLAGKTLAMIFTKSSTRTRVAFEVGIYQLGGTALFLSERDIQLGRGESVADTARVLSRMVDGVMIRTFSHAEVEELARHAAVPVINGLTDYLHPTQVLADLMTIEEHKGRLAGLKLAYIGDGGNVAHSLLIGCSKMGMDITLACPAAYEPREEILRAALANGAESGSRVRLVRDPLEAARDADALYTDVWASMGQEGESAERRAAFKGYCLDDAALAAARPDVIVLHCLPAHKGEEITEAVFEGPRSVVFDEAENRLHAHKAVMALLMGNTD
ncbi:MAG: ornithine carbamoyltransferase [Gracilibacteraceae bacterium]|jgi:ornithine carbamoyltransferase|nr:ornithine carbamoyltransferase [Gracilibacteraceae bacterium]